MDAFWEECARQGVTSKRLAVLRAPHTASPVGIGVGEAVKYGAPIVSVPYSSVLNGQTLRGDLLPRALPPLRKAVTFLTRRGRMGTVSAHSLWLAGFLACYAADAARAHGPLTSSLDPLLNDAVYPSLPNLFVPAHASCCPSLRGVAPEELRDAALRVSGEVDVCHSMLRHYAKRRGLPSHLCPSSDALALSYRTVMQRALLLPWNCEPSAPGDLSELMAASPDIALLPSLVPVVDMIRSAPPAAAAQEGDEAAEAAEAMGSANCTLFTCVQSDFLSAASRRRVVVETSPLAARRVVVCAAKAIKEGEELLMDFE